MSEYNAFAKYYDTLTFNVDYKKRAEYFDKIIKKYKKTENNILLDLGCGTGSLSQELDSLGYDVIGVDNSPMMLDMAIEKKFESGKNIQYLCQDIKNIDMFGTFGVCICALDTLNHLNTLEEVKQVFDKVSLFSEKGSVFVFDINTPYKHREVLKNNVFVYDTKEVYCIWQNDFVGGENNKVDIYLDFFAKEENGLYSRQSEDFSEVAYNIEDVLKILEDSNMKVFDCFEGDSFENIRENSQRAVIVSGKEN